MNVFKIATIAALAAGMAIAQPATPAQGGGHKAARHRMFQALDLSDAQKQQAKQIFQQARETAQPVAKQLRENREALQAAVKANNLSQIQTLSAQAGPLQAQLLAIRSEAMAKFYATLTPEQRTKADQIQARVRQRMQKRKSIG